MRQTIKKILTESVKNKIINLAYERGLITAIKYVGGYEEFKEIVGDDYMHKEVIGSKYCQQVLFFKKIKGYSTTNILG